MVILALLKTLLPNPIRQYSESISLRETILDASFELMVNDASPDAVEQERELGGICGRNLALYRVAIEPRKL